MNFRTLPTDFCTEQELTEWTSLEKRARLWPTAWVTPVQMVAWTVRSKRRWLVASALEEHCARMTPWPTQQKLHQDYLSNGSDDHIKQGLVKQHHQLHRQAQVVQASLSSAFSSVAMIQGPSLLTEKKIQAFKTKCLRNFSASSTWSTKPMSLYTASSSSLWAHIFWKLSTDRN